MLLQTGALASTRILSRSVSRVVNYESAHDRDKVTFSVDRGTCSHPVAAIFLPLHRVNFVHAINNNS